MNYAARAAFGKDCEDTACRYLQSQGLILLERNYKQRIGEIDLIMQDKEQLVFVEVRGKHRLEHGDALESIDPPKVNKIIRTAILYLQTNECLYTKDSRFDIVLIHPIDGKMQLEWLKNAFTVDRF
jgi:putative endonuclease